MCAAAAGVWRAGSEEAVVPAWWALPLLGAGLNAAGDALGFGAAKGLANTAHQREVRDLRAAGLNPILSAMGGSGAGMPQVPDFGASGANAVASAQQGRRLEQEIRVMKQQAFAANAQGLKAGAEAETAYQSQPFLVQSARAAAKRSEMENQLIDAELPAARSRKSFDQTLRGQNAAKMSRFIQGILGNQRR